MLKLSPSSPMVPSIDSLLHEVLGYTEICSNHNSSRSACLPSGACSRRLKLNFQSTLHSLTESSRYEQKTSQVL